MHPYRLVIFAFSIAVLSTTSVPAEDSPYQQQQNVVYGEAHGIGLIMDVFVPTGAKNGLAIVDVISGAWHSDRGKIRDHTRTQTFDILCRKGYVVFGIRPGSITKFSAPEMRSHLNTGIRWVKSHAEEYGIDPNRVGMMGASAGGHLACLTAVTAEEATTVDGKALPSTNVKAVAVFFPPTDFLEWSERSSSAAGGDQWRKLTQRLAFAEPPENLSDEEMTNALRKISPARLVTSKAPPFLLIHGDADERVPLKHSEKMLAALTKEGVSAELIVKKGGGHPWLTIHEEVQVIADWFDKQLLPK